MAIKYLKPHYWLAFMFLLASAVHMGSNIGFLEMSTVTSGYMLLLLGVPFLVPAVMKVANKRVSTVGYIGMATVIAAGGHILNIVNPMLTGAIALLGSLYIIGDRFNLL